MSKQKESRGATAKQLVWVEEVEKVWDTPITGERKDWTTQYLAIEEKLREKHEGRLTQEAAVALTKRDRNVEKMVGKHGLKMRVSDLTWAWVAQKIQDGQAVE